MFGILVRLALALSGVTLITRSVACSNRVFLIRHGEKVDDNDTGLSSRGEQRAECIAKLFSNDNGYHIGLILVQQYKSNGKRRRPYLTAKPLAQQLGLEIDHSCDRDDAACAADAITSFGQRSALDVLVVWEHKALGSIGAALGAPFKYPKKRFDLIYEIQDGKLADGYPISEHCPRLDS